MPIARFGLIFCLLVPLALLAWDARGHRLGVNAVNYAIHTTGFIAILCLVLSLVVTPLRQLTNWNWLVQFRRAMGVYAFYYACAHLSIYFWWDRGRNLSSTFHEITHRYYLAIGFSSLALMAPLWATSFDAAIRAMGGTWWKRLHRLAYVAAALGCAHYYLQSKADKRVPDLLIAILAGLLLWRAVAAIVHRVRMPARSKAMPATALPGAKARSWKGDLQVVGVFGETPTVSTFRLALPDGTAVPFAFRAGQYLNLSLPIDGKRVSRSYTIASPPTRDACIELTIKREEHGQVSHYFHDTLKTGHSITVSAPVGRFTFDSTSTEGVLLIAGGVGITPIMSILRDLTDRCWPGKIDLVFSIRSLEDVIFADELRLLAARHPNVHVHLTITRDAPAKWAGARGRITRDVLKQLVPDVASRPAFVCGPDTMAATVRDELIALGVPTARITLESFTPVAAMPAADPATGETPGTATSTITFARSDRSAASPSGKSILDVAEAVGVPIDFQCRSGICGTCRCKLLSGDVTMAVQDALTDEDKAEGYILACQAHPAGDVTIDA